MNMKRERGKSIEDNTNYTFANGIATTLLETLNKKMRKIITASTGKEELTMCICSHLETLESLGDDISDVYGKGQITRELIRILQDGNNVAAAKELITLLGIENDETDVEINLINFSELDLPEKK